MNPLDQLRDIHLPPSVSWWPPAPGWWVLAFLLLAGIGYLLIRVRANWLAKAYRREALQQLKKLKLAFDQHQDSQRYLQELLALLRRTVKTVWPERHWESLPAGQFVENIFNKNFKKYQIIKADIESCLYRRNNIDCLPVTERFETLVRDWLKNHRRGGQC